MRFAGFPGHFGGSFWLHDLFLLLIVIAVIVGVYVLVRGFTLRSSRPWDRPGPRPYDDWHRGPRSPAVDELDLRYARGEVDREEYLRRRADLLGGPPPPSGGPSAPGPAPKT